MSGTLLALVLAGLFAVVRPAPAVAACVSDTSGVDPFVANGSVGALLGEAPGQTFTVQDTLVEFIKVWRVASQDSAWYIGIHLYITETNAAGVPQAGNVVLDGPTLVVPFGDGIHPIEFKWTFDPPIVLPHRGKYALFFFQDPCLSYWDILASDNDPYPDGDAWLTGRSSCALFRNINLSEAPGGDLIFQVGTCSDAVTAAKKTTWGELKLLYR